MSTIHLNATVLAGQMRETLGALSVAPDAIQHTVDGLVETSLRGVDSHGIQLFPHYCNAVAGGRINPHPQMVFRPTGPATGVLDADHGFGHHGAATAMAHAVELAANAGAGMVAVANSTHFGAAAYSALRAARSGRHLAMAFTNADALVKAARARTAWFGTNPICFCAPLDGEDPLCLDMATSTISWNRVRTLRASGGTLQPGWAFDAQGQPTQDPHQAAMLAPVGDYKGFGLGMLVDVLCGLLSDGPVAHEVAAMFTTPLSLRRRIGHFVMALEIDRFVPAARFRSRLTALVGAIRAEPPLEQQPVMVPGDPEKACLKVRSQTGIPVTSAIWAGFLELRPQFSRAVMP